MSCLLYEVLMTFRAEAWEHIEGHAKQAEINAHA